MINSVSERSTFFIPLGTSPFQFGPAVPRGSGAEIVKVKGVSIGELNAEVAIFPVHRWQGEHDRFGAQIQTHPRVGSVRVGSLDRYVSWREDTRDVGDLVPGCLEFGTLP